MHGLSETFDVFGLLAIGFITMSTSPSMGKGIITLAGILFVINWMIHCGSSAAAGSILDVKSKQIKKAAHDAYINK